MKPYENGTVYGPYTRAEDNRKHVVITFPDGTRKTVSYPRYLVETSRGEYLTDTDEVHHRNGDETNDSLDNLVVVNGTIHRMIHGGSGAVWTCATCGVEFSVTSLQVSRRKTNLKLGRAKSGPFCSKSCNGKVNN